MEPLKLFEVSDGGIDEWVAAPDARTAALLSLSQGLHQSMESDELTVRPLDEKAARGIGFDDEGERSDLWTVFLRERRPVQIGAEPEAKIIGGTEY